MKDWLINLWASVLGGLIVSLIEWAVRRLREHPLEWKRFEWKRFARIAAFVTLLLLCVFTYVVPPYSINDATWCLTPEGTTRVGGHAVRTVVRTPVVEVTVQVKIFPAGSDQALQREEFGTTDWNGRFTVDLPPPQPTTGMYLINIAYNYDSPAWPDRWDITDFRKANPPKCR